METCLENIRDVSDARRSFPEHRTASLNDGWAETAECTFPSWTRALRGSHGLLRAPGKSYSPLPLLVSCGSPCPEPPGLHHHTGVKGLCLFPPSALLPLSQARPWQSNVQ